MRTSILSFGICQVRLMRQHLPPGPLFCLSLLHQLPLGTKVWVLLDVRLWDREKQADASVRPMVSASKFPSIVVEVGSSESIGQLRIDMRLWIEHSPEIELGILLSIDPPVQPNPTLPRITVELWRHFPPVQPSCTPVHRMREGRRVWQVDWTLAASPLYVFLSDIFL